MVKPEGGRNKTPAELNSISSVDDHGGGGFLADSKASVEKEGALQKWTNYIKGYRTRWFVLDSHGNLSYYRNKSEVGVSCRGSINLQEARILTDPSANTLTISGTSQSFHLKANNEVDRENWLAALEFARHHAVKRADTEEDDALAVNNDTDLEKLVHEAKNTLNKKLDDLRASEAQIKKLATELTKAAKNDDKLALDKVKALKNHAENLIQSSESLVQISKKEVHMMSRFAMNEHEQRLQLQEQIETLAKQHSSLERATIKGPGSNTDQTPYSESDDEFHDAQEAPEGMIEDVDQYDFTVVTGDSSSRQDSLTDADTDSSSNKQLTLNSTMQDLMSTTNHNDPFFAVSSNCEIRERRSRIPNRPDYPLNLWSIMRNCIGKELTKIPMPVNFNEPLSVLQRITEDLEYADLFDRASEIKDSCEQMCYVAAYSVSCYSTTGNRTTKPFNPVLGETYECERIADRGWWSITEQVSHHPPSTAHHAEGRAWMMYQDFTMTSRFRGKYLSVTPTGFTHVKFKNSKNHYTYKKITTTVHNIIVGKLWIDNHGDTLIENHETGDKCQLKFHAYSYFSPDKARKVTGVVKNKKGTPRYVIQGYWDQYIEIAKVIKHDKNNIETGSFQRIWTINPPLENNEKMYRFTKLAIELNEPEDGVAPTDSRNRPDQRLMEEGKWDDANRIKEEVEERQRQARRKREEEAEQAMRKGLSYPEYKPAWFDKNQDEYTNSVIHVFNGDYWRCKKEQDWSRCPSIF